MATTQQLQARVEAFRTQKETLKASYTAAQAQTRIGEAVSGISESMSDTGLAMQRAQDRIAQMQARAGAVDELLASGALNDLSGSSVDPLQAELDRGSRQSQVDFELAQLKGQLAGPTAGQAALGANAAAAQPVAGAIAAGAPGAQPRDDAASTSGAAAPAAAGGSSAPPGAAPSVPLASVPAADVPADDPATRAPQQGADASAVPVASTIGGDIDAGEADAGEADDGEPVDGELAPPAGSPPGTSQASGDLFSLGN